MLNGFLVAVVLTENAFFSRRVAGKRCWNNKQKRCAGTKKFESLKIDNTHI